MRTLVADAAEMAGMGVSGISGAKPDVDGNPGGTELCMPLACDLRIGILDRSDHPGNSSGNDRIRARRRFAEMRARLQRHIDRGAARGLAGLRQRHRLGMWTAAGLRPSSPDDDAVFHDDRSDGRVRPGPPQTAPTEGERELHEAPVDVLLPGLLRELIFQNAK